MLTHWLAAFRLRTLPLALSGIVMGSALALERFRGEVFWGAILTATLLQILSNLANDYGDSQHGADSAEREGPSRTVQAGHISKKAMRNAIALFVVLSLTSGLGLLYFAFGTANPQAFGAMFGVGVAAILAALGYTMGRKPYGYVGLGDLAVLLFFGWAAVPGVYFLHTLVWDWGTALPGTACGLLAVAVLNVNNVRDIRSDEKAGKRSLPVRFGRVWAVRYHGILLAFSLLLSGAYALTLPLSPFHFLFLLAAPLFWRNFRAVQKFDDAKKLDPYLKQMAMSTLVFVLLFSLGLWLGR